MQTFRADDLTSTYGEKTLFEKISFLINENDRIGLIGTNGSGKTSLLNVISGQVGAEAGQITTPNDYSIGYLKQQPELDESLTILDAIFSGAQKVFATIRLYEAALEEYSQNPEDEGAVDRFTRAQAQMDAQDAWTAESEVKTILTQLKITNLNQKISTLSGGQKKRVGFAQILIEAPDLLLLDEPTNHLDLESIVWLQSYLKSYRGAVIIVTHDRYFLDEVANQIWELSFGALYKYSGNYQSFVAQKAERVAREAEQEHKQTQLYQKELAWMRTGAKARSTKQKGRINHFNELQDSIGNVQTDENIAIDLGQQRLGKDVIEITNGGLTLGNHKILDDFNLLVQAGDRIGITGENGTGKSSLLNVLAGKLPLDSGVVKIGETVKLGYYTQQTEPIDGDKRMLSYLSDVAETVTDSNGDSVSSTQLLERFLFPRFMHGTLIRKLSGGEKRRLFLLKILMSQPNVLLLDEPTNDLDIGTLTILEDYLDTFAGTVITVSHDRYFLDKVADRLMVFSGQGQIDSYNGLYTDYLAKQNETVAAPEKVKPATSQSEEKPTEKKKKLTYSEQKEWETIETEIEELDEKQTDLKRLMEENGADYSKLSEYQEELTKVSKLADEKMARWEYLSEYAE
ncbi:ABC-F family ATP-binding cassette domain-containing protein [Paucilactobacillus nenjiangensis]|jgi:ATP-binding cassette subfamily F protein uup|uniref:ABC-F family ATP-binding cassette domain-containing protein n=1 Tax=Paucilactobacillus nenjiangensis TaxID=1296540 RepID=A0A5P1X4M3_9LACO|nr:ABC-F family ATP-binding cassette domain-containing protein [Paucilactobacillus nenjiangensis]QER67441.1 ABC-F family ATP-binding cassette domain-containing protein [Paucilactobacillus nenjiangensis]